MAPKRASTRARDLSLLQLNLTFVFKNDTPPAVRPTPTTSARRFAARCAALALVAACSGSADVDDSADAGGNPDAGAQTPPPAYLVQSGIQTPDGRTVYMSVLGSLRDPIDLARAVELGSSSRVRTAFGKVFAFNSETLEVTRFAVGDDLAVAEEDRFTMSPAGIGRYGWSITFVNQQLALYTDVDTRQFIFWNPTAMEVVEAVPFADDIPMVNDAGRAHVSSDGQHIIVPFNHQSFEDLSTVPGARAAVLSVASRSLVNVAYDERCPYSNQGFVDPSTGDYVYVGDALYGFSTHFGVPPERSACLLRIRAGDTDFDPGWVRNGSELNADGFTDVGAVTVAGDQFLAVVRDETAAPIADIPTPFSYFGGEGVLFRPYIGSTSDWIGARVRGLEERSFFGFPFVVDDRFVLSPVDTTARDSSAVVEVFDVTADGTFRKLTETVGFIQEIARIR